MGFKNMKPNFTFADISLFNSMEKNRAIKRMELINVTVDWSRIENMLLKHYPVGKSFEGNDAYPPLLLMKCLLLQQWFKIDSDPELETQINCVFRRKPPPDSDSSRHPIPIDSAMAIRSIPPPLGRGGR